MKLSVFFLLICFNFCAFAQLKPIYFIGDRVTSDSTRATSYGIFGKLSSEELYILKTYDLANNLIFTGSFKDEALKIPHGDFVYYSSANRFKHNLDRVIIVHDTYSSLEDGARFIACKGSYVDGYQNGRWINFFPDGKILSIITYVMGIKHGFTGTYNKRGKLMISGTYKLDKKDGEWTNGKVKETFVNGILQLPAKKSGNKSNK